MNARSLRLVVPMTALAIGVVLLAATLYLTFFDRNAPAVSAIGGPFQLVAQDGRTFTDKDLKGEPTLMFFGYTHCPDVCPTTLFDMSETFKKLGTDAKIRGVFVTVDPERDTPAVMKDYLSNFDPRIIGLSGDKSAVDVAIKDYRVYARKVPTENGEYTMDHTALVYLLDKQGRFVNAFNLDRPPQDAAKDLQRHL
jgi:protein SCO1/2